MKEEMIKISMPLIDDIELQRIDNFYNDIVDEYTKAYVKEKEQVIVQQLMKNLREENKSLQSQLKAKEEAEKEFIKYLEKEINKNKEQINNYDIWHEVGTDINFLILKKQFNIEILSKFNEILSKGGNK